jgi:hypothetical protein
LLDAIMRERTLAPKVHTAFLRFGDAVHLPLTPDVVFKFSN